MRRSVKCFPSGLSGETFVVGFSTRIISLSLYFVGGRGVVVSQRAARAAFMMVPIVYSEIMFFRGLYGAVVVWDVPRLRNTCLLLRERYYLALYICIECVCMCWFFCFICYNIVSSRCVVACLIGRNSTIRERELV